MLDRLPLELLDEVLDHLPSPTRYNVPRERTDTLLACRLVSKLVFSRATLLLWRDTRTIEILVEKVDSGAAEPLKPLVRSFQGGMSYAPAGLGGKRILAVLLQFSSIKDLGLWAGGELCIDLNLLATSLPLLTTLRLAQVVVAPFSRHTIFPHLRSLTLHCLYHTPTSTTLLPAAINCPALRALVINPDQADSEDRSLLSSFDHRLARQLDMLQVQGEHSSVRSILPSPVETLISVDDQDIIPPVSFPVPATHLRFCSLASKPESHTVDLLSRLIRPASRSLHLPSSLQIAPFPSTDELVKPIADLLSLCNSLGVEVLWYDPSEEGNYELSPSFWRYAKRLKAEKEAATAS